MKKLILINLFSLFLFSELAFAQNYFTCNQDVKSENDILKQVASNFSSIESLKAQFEQRSVLLGFGHTQSSNGQLVFKKVGMMDWHYKTPEEQRFITNGKTVWFYQKALNQVTLSNFNNTFSTDLPVSFLLGLSSLDKEFNLSKACKSDLGIVLKLVPIKKDPNLSKFELVVEQDSKSPLAIKITDVGGNDTEILLSKVEQNLRVEAKRFEFNIPRGVDIINQ